MFEGSAVSTTAVDLFQFLPENWDKIEIECLTNLAQIKPGQQW